MTFDDLRMSSAETSTALISSCLSKLLSLWHIFLAYRGNDVVYAMPCVCGWNVGILRLNA